MIDTVHRRLYWFWDDYHGHHGGVKHDAVTEMGSLQLSYHAIGMVIRYVFGLDGNDDRYGIQVDLNANSVTWWKPSGAERIPPDWLLVQLMLTLD